MLCRKPLIRSSQSAPRSVLRRGQGALRRRLWQRSLQHGGRGLRRGEHGFSSSAVSFFRIHFILHLVQRLAFAYLRLYFRQIVRKNGVSTLILCEKTLIFREFLFFMQKVLHFLKNVL